MHGGPCAWMSNPLLHIYPNWVCPSKPSSYSTPWLVPSTLTSTRIKLTVPSFLPQQFILLSFLNLPRATASSQWPRCKNADSFLPSLIPIPHQLSNPASSASSIPRKSVPSLRFPMHLPPPSLPLLLTRLLLQQVSFFGPLHISIPSRLTFRDYSSIYFPLVHQSIILPHSLEAKVQTPPLTLVYISNLCSSCCFIYTLCSQITQRCAVLQICP